MGSNNKFLFLLLLNIALSSGLEILNSVQVLFRNGEKELDGTREVGGGPLTDKGKLQMFDLGTYLRSRYEGFIHTEFDSAETSFLSSDKDPIIQSASLVAYGLYLDFNMAATWSGDENIQYEPIPVRTLPRTYDNLLQLSKPCPKNDILIEESLAEYSKKFINENQDFLEVYAKERGDRAILDGNREGAERIQSFPGFLEEVYFNYTNNLPVEGWEKEVLNNEDLLRFKAGWFGNYIDTDEKKRLYNGPVIKNILSIFEAEAPKKISLFSAHDHTLYTLMTTLGIWDSNNLVLPPEGAALIIEYYASVGILDTGSYMKFWYYNNTSEEPRYLEVPSCGQPCYISNFKEVFNNIIPENAEQECKLDANVQASRRNRIGSNGKRVLPRIIPGRRKTTTTSTSSPKIIEIQTSAPETPESNAPRQSRPILLSANVPEKQLDMSALNITMGVVVLCVVAGALIFALFGKRRQYTPI